METRSGFIAIVGKPNVGKSSLLNALVGEKVAIVSDKPQTTRTRIMGVLTRGETQYVFIDTPGLHKPRTKLSEHMVKAVGESIADVDAAVLVVEPDGPVTKAELDLIENFKRMRIPAILCINKIDLLQKKEDLMKRILAYSQLFDFEAVIPISALQGDGIDIVFSELDKHMQPGPHFFPDDMLTDQPERVVASEIIREKMLRLLRDEIPHGAAVAIESMKERENGQLTDVEAVIYCERESHKGIIIGKGGRMLKEISSQARADMEGFFGVHINLQCWVKVKEDWRNREGIIRSLGLS